MKIFKAAYRYWMIFAKKLAIIPTTIILFIIYFGAIGAISLINFILGKDLLEKRSFARSTYWHDKEHIPTDIERCRRQF